MSPKILITGNLGYIGPCVTRHLRGAVPDVRLVGLDTGFFAGNLLDARHLPEAAVDEQIPGDVRDIGGDIFAGVDGVVHLAGISNDPIGHAYAAVTHEINCESTRRIAELARRAGARSFVFASSCSVYGFAEGGPRTESSELGPLTAYAKSKVAAEQALAGLAGDGFTVTCLRFATACGLSPRLRLDLVLNDFVATAVSTGEIRILSDGTPWRPLIDVSDMARAIEWAVFRSAADGGAYLAVNVGSNDWNFQVRDLAAAVAAAIPGSTIRINPDAQPDKRSYRVNFDLFGRLAPRHQVLSTPAATIAALHLALQAAGAAEPGFDPTRLIRLKTLGVLRETGRIEESLRWVKSAGTTS